MPVPRPLPTRVPILHCEATIGWEPRADGFGSVPVKCLQSVGLTHWRDSSGSPHSACPHHVAQRKHRYPERVS